MDSATRDRIEAAAFRRLTALLRHRTDVQNVDLMGVGGFCRNCLSDWLAEAAAERGVTLSKDEARQMVYGMPYADYKKRHQTEAMPEQLERMALSVARNHREVALDEALDESFPASDPPEHGRSLRVGTMGVTGIGGIFFRARDPAALSAWYVEHLSVGPGCAAPGRGAPNEWFWQADGGPTVFAPFAESSDYFAADKRFMLNFRVDGLDALLERLRGAGIAVETRADWDTPETGQFARIHDPEGNAIELWQPPAGG